MSSDTEGRLEAGGAAIDYVFNILDIPAYYYLIAVLLAWLLDY